MIASVTYAAGRCEYRIFREQGESVRLEHWRAPCDVDHEMVLDDRREPEFLPNARCAMSIIGIRLEEVS